MLASSLSKVLLPEPLRPTMPKNSPWSDVEGDAVEGPQDADIAGREGAHHALLQRVHPVGGDGEGLLQVPRFDREGRGRPRRAGDYGFALRLRSSVRAPISAPVC